MVGDLVVTLFRAICILSIYFVIFKIAAPLEIFLPYRDELSLGLGVLAAFTIYKD